MPPEITSVEAIRAKLREFEQRMDGAIAAAHALTRINADAEKLLVHIKGVEAKTNKTDTKIQRSLEDAERASLQLNRLHEDWKTLKQQLETAQNDTRAIGKTLLSQLDKAVHSLARQVVDAEERLKSVNKLSQAEQTDLFSQLAASSKTNANAAEKAQSFVANTAMQLNNLLVTLRENLQDEIHDQFEKSEKLIESEVQRIEAHLEQTQGTLLNTVEITAESYQQQLREEMTAFKADIQRNLVFQEQAIDRRLTDFLNKQNAMVQNLSQQIDSFNRSSQAQSTNIGIVQTRVAELAQAFGAQRDVGKQEMRTLMNEVAELSLLLGKVEVRFKSQDDTMAATARRLEQTIDQLKKGLIFGNFKSI